jgi:glycosyltransferase involved in cell wall biosynthesis
LTNSGFQALVTINPLVSVVIPAYNRAHTLRRAVDSVLNQTYTKIEVLIIDDGSTDNTHETLRLYGDKIRWWSQKNAGPSRARNSGIKEARGEYVAFLDSDDAWAPKKLERQMGLLLRCSADVVCCLCDTRFTGQKYLGKTAFEVAKIFPTHEEAVWINATEVLITRFVLFNQAVVVRRDVLISHGTFDGRLRLMEDYDLALRLSTAGPWALISEPLVSWYLDAPTSLSHSAKRIESDSLASEILERFALNFKLDCRLAALLNRRRRVLYHLIQLYRLRECIGKKFFSARPVVEALFSIIERLYGRLEPLPKVVTVPVDADSLRV